jgi:hypothetical protein
MFSSLGPRRLVFSSAVFLAVSWAVPARAQSPGSYPPVPDSPGISGNQNPDQYATAMAVKMARERNVLRQKVIIDETNQLLDLARQLKDAVNKSDKDQLSVDVVRKAEEIEKLAKDVKTKMRDGTA